MSEPAKPFPMLMIVRAWHDRDGKRVRRELSIRGMTDRAPRATFKDWCESRRYVRVSIDYYVGREEKLAQGDWWVRGETKERDSVGGFAGADHE